MATPEYLGHGNDDGTLMGRSTTDKIGFYGLATAIVQPAATAQSALSTTAITTLATTPTATDIAVAVNSLISGQSAVITLVNQIRSDLISLNLVKGSA